jgi:hypothetical protein
VVGESAEDGAGVVKVQAVRWGLLKVEGGEGPSRPRDARLRDADELADEQRTDARLDGCDLARDALADVVDGKLVGYLMPSGAGDLRLCRLDTSTPASIGISMLI